MTIDQLVAMTASIGACMSAIAAFLTVKQISKQRESSYRPELAISQTEFECISNPLTNKKIPDTWVIKNRNSQEKEIDFFKNFTIPLRNVGLGAAKEVSIKWSFPFEKTVIHVNDLAQKSLTPAYFEFKNQVLTLNSDNLGSYASMWGNQQKTKIDFVLPAPIDQMPVELILPLAYIQLASALVYFSAKTKNFDFKNEIPTLHLSLDYLDIGGKKYQSKFAIDINLSMIANEGEMFSGYIESKNYV
jgi:hypothetical protein